MKQQSYFRSVNPGNDSVDDVRSTGEPLLVNCTGIVAMETPFSTLHVGGRQDYYLQYMLKGRLTAYPGGQPCPFEEGMFMIYSPHTTYHYELPDGSPMQYYWAHFTGFHAGRMLANLGLQSQRIYRIGDSPRQRGRIREAIEQMFVEFAHRRPGFDEATSALLSQILVELTRGADKVHMGEMRKLETVAYLHSHFREELPIPALAEMEHLSESRYRTVFRRHTGVSPGEYRTALRMQHACELLAMTDLSVTEIAADCGYTDVLYFLRIFKHKVGCTPREYRVERRTLSPEEGAVSEI